MLSYLGFLELVLVVLGGIVGVLTFWAIVAYILLGISERIDELKKKYAPQYYYYDWNEEE